MDFGLSSGEDSESEEDEPPEGFTAAVLEDRAGWAELAHSSSVLPVTIREIHSHFVKRRLKREHYHHRNRQDSTKYTLQQIPPLAQYFMLHVHA